MSDRAKIRARRVTGNNAQQQATVAMAIKNAREMALLPYATGSPSSVADATAVASAGRSGPTARRRVPPLRRPSAGATTCSIDDEDPSVDGGEALVGADEAETMQ